MQQAGKKLCESKNYEQDNPLNDSLLIIIFYTSTTKKQIFYSCTRCYNVPFVHF